MTPRRPMRRHLLAALLVGFATLAHPAVHALAPAPHGSVEAADAIPQAALLQPAELNSLLHATQKPTVLQVGSRTLFTEAHIPGSEYTGAAATPQGREILRTRVAKLPKNAEIVLYCGCCPWGRCPNIRPAYSQLRSLGYTNVKVLYLPQDFGTDWANKGFPVERGN